jgi:NADH:ubiquinone oxidoreductase subunit F (NADH-binding)
MPDPYLLPAEPIETLDAYVAAGGGVGLDAARRLGSDGTLDEIVASGLRGRGGAGFPTGRKWQSVRDGGGGTRYVVANGAEGEPASFKDRVLMARDPYRVVEGAAIAALAVGASQVYLATKASYRPQVEALTRAAVELGGAGLLGDLTCTVVEGPDEYLFGEEKALLEVIEGREPLPRLLPPYQHGLFATVPAGGWEAEATALSASGSSNPTVVNNVETLATVAHILARGATWFRSAGTAASPGMVLTTVVGDVARAGVHEVELGTPFSDLLRRCGGPLPGRTFTAAFSGVSSAVLPADRFDTPLTYEDFTAVGSGLGAAGFVVYDDTADLLAVAAELSRFLSVESCGQCPPCKQGSLAITEHLVAIRDGRGDDHRLEQLNARLRSVTDANRCALGTGEQQVVSSVLRSFPEAVAAHLEGRARPPRRVPLVPLVKDITPEGTVTWDERHAAKRPDWTFADHG